MPQKRRSRGRTKGGKGRSELVQCSQCGAHVPRDKAKKVTVPIRLVDVGLAKELRDKGVFLPRSYGEKWYCISCAVHRGVTKVRAKVERRFA